MKRRICVTKKDISTRTIKDLWQCPVARVLQRKFNDQYHSEGAVKVIVGHSYIRLHFRGGTQWHSKNRKKITSWLREYDTGRHVEPLSFIAEFVRTTEKSLRWW